MTEFRGSPNADVLQGGDGADTIYGSGGDDVLRGGGGNDVLYAGDGVATNGNLGVGGTPGETGTTNLLYGEDGADILYGDAGKDTLDGGAGDDTLNGSTGDTLLGGDGADRLLPLGGGAQMVLDGGAGDDVIGYGVGLGDGNKATGGAGADRFEILFSNQWSTRGVSSITDFKPAEGDRLGVGTSSLSPQFFRGAVDNPNFSLQMGDVFSTTRDYGADTRQIWTWAKDGGVYLIVDTDGSRTLSASDVLVRLEGVSSVTAGDFAEGSFATSSFTTKFGTDGTDNYVGANSATYYGLTGDDVIHASNGGDRIHGGPGKDTIWGGASADLFWGGDGDDWIDGGGSMDTAIYSGDLTNYAISRNADGSLRVQDLRGVDGVDTLFNVQRLEFAGQYVAVSYLPNPSVEASFKAVLRASSEAPSQLVSVMAMSDYVTLGAAPIYINKEIVKAAGATTSVASMAYEFFTGKVPTEAGVDYLVSPTGPNANNLNSAYYQSFNLENRYINFAVNLGKLGEGRAQFETKYGALSLFDATREAYKAIFGGTPTDEKVHALIDTRVDYFASYGGDGVNGVGTKAAMVGWLLAEAIKADVGVMAKSNDAWLMDLATDGSAPFAIDILDPTKGYWKADFIFGG